ncbi:MAG: hypothetical protein RLZZ508_635, partial [Actinomycetota bacterium]
NLEEIMKILGTKFALPIASVAAVLALVGVQAMALSQSPSDEISIPADAKLADESATTNPATSEPEPSTTPLVIPTDGPTTPPSDDDDEYEDEDEDEYEDEDEDEDDEYEDEDEDEDEEDDD